MTDGFFYSVPPPGPDDFANMLHALGRTGDAPGWRNRYCTEAGGPTAQRFEALGWWTRHRTINDGRDAIYRVNARGKAALAEYLKARTP